MKRLIRFSALLIAVVLCFVTNAYAADSYFELNGFAFSVSEEGEATIRGYSGSDTEVVIPQKLLGAPVVAIGDYAFYGSDIASVSFEQATALKAIGNGSFYGCKSLVEVTVPSDVALSFGSFQNCTSLTRLTIADGIGEIPEQCFYGCSSIAEVSLPASVTEIGIRAFGECQELRYVYLTNAVTAIEQNAFENDEALIVRCPEDSYAAQFAEEKGIPCEYPSSELYLRGDADGDGDITVVDATTIQRLIAYLIPDPDGMISMRGSVCGDEYVTIRDVTAILRYLAQMKNLFRVGDEATVYYTAASA